MKLNMSSLGVMSVAFEPGDLIRAKAERSETLDQRVSPELLKLIADNPADQQGFTLRASRVSPRNPRTKDSRSQS